ncbi:hypothetical protein Chor_005500 [Crotalus horridus]
MTLNIQRGSPGGPCQRRASTPVPASHRERLSPRCRGAEPCHPQLGQSLSCEPRACLPEPCGGWRSESPSSEESSGSLYRVVFLGDPGVGKSSLFCFCFLPEDTYERTLSVDGEETTLVAIDPWEAEKRSLEEGNWLHNYCMLVGNAYVLVYSITDRASFESASELRIQLRRTRQAENIPIILVGNKTDLHNVTELFEGVVRQIRLRQDSKEANERRRSLYKRKESLTKKVRRFLDRLVARNNQKVARKVRSKSCHDLSVL